MRTDELLNELRQRGVSLQAVGDKLRYCPRDAVPPELLNCLREQKSEVLARLKAADEMLELARRLGWPRIELLRDRWTPSDESGWRDFVRTAEPDDVRLAREILRCRLAEGERRPATGDETTRASGRRLLQELWNAGFQLRLEKSQFGDGFVLIPYGQGSPGTDFRRLYDLFEACHDAAVRLLVETCWRLQIPPEKWHIEAPKLWQRLTAEKVVAETAASVQRKTIS